MTNPDCPTCHGTNKVIVPEGKDRVTIGFFNYMRGMACPRCKADAYNDPRSSMIAGVSSSHIEDRLERTGRPFGLSIEHPDIIEAAAKVFWNECRVDLGKAVLACNDMWRDPVDEFEKVREAVRKGMRAAMKEATRMQLKSDSDPV